MSRVLRVLSAGLGAGVVVTESAAVAPQCSGGSGNASCPSRSPQGVDLMQRSFVHSELAMAQHLHGDYDCDGDGVQDCGKCDYRMGMCTNQQMCGHLYKFPDASLDRSCRCRRCPAFPGTAFGDTMLKNPEQAGAPFNAMSWGLFKTWADHMNTCAPWVMPRDDTALRNLLAHAREKSYKVRISGAGHSAGGIVTDGQNRQVLVLSLAEYTAPGEWEFGIRDMPNGSKRATANAGWTQFHLYEKIRPLGFFVPAQTAGYFFSLGGIVANSVHGGSYHSGFVHGYATRMRVMLFDGSIKMIDTEEEMRYWRCSFGLHGIILGVEMQLEQREQLQMYVVKEKMSAWNSEEFWKFIKQSAEADLPAEVLPAEGGQGSRKSWNGEFFVDFMNGGETPQVISYSQKANHSVDPDFDGELGIPENVHEGYAYMKNKRVAEDGRGWMSWGEAARRDGAPPIKIAGVEVNDMLDSMKALPLAGLLSKAAVQQIPGFVERMSKRVNDGFFLTYSPAALAAAYFVEPSKGFAAMDYLRKVQLESKGSKDFVWNLPGEFRFLNVQDSAVLQPVKAGIWFNAQMI
eukprot:CAMPEP_0177314768 /NCGR_PEP_ID=MMETSP0368-20130122/12102_1 /TAXON_ID=447022 ORGANISM="Scrippsiella hangoei-like, Strain SHHI-4" /NCGR_SAMPLE_ID=MMETSP0368 /ASSEMBLY_ACC=CAM_ASM_000363 /LENGTH=572 /DNA_ID=CAMNT_0018773923 /DNA_START=59 /DNA_END=1774 /DNA_ORIENTATION=+